MSSMYKQNRACKERKEYTATYRNDGEHGVGLRVFKQDIYKRDDLQGLAQAHAVGKDTAEATAALRPLQRLHQVIIQEPDPTDLMGEGEKRKDEEREGQK